MALSNRDRSHILERDDHKCRFCSGISSLEVHHVQYRSKFGKKGLDEQEDDRNLITLCYKCHHIRLHEQGIIVIVYFKTKPDLPTPIWKKDLPKYEGKIVEVKLPIEED